MNLHRRDARLVTKRQSLKDDPPIKKKMRLRHLNRQPFNPQSAVCRVFECTAEDHEKLKTWKEPKE